MLFRSADGADMDTVQSQIQEIVAPAYVFEVLDADELSDQVGQLADQMLAVLYALLGLMHSPEFSDKSNEAGHIF